MGRVYDNQGDRQYSWASVFSIIMLGVAVIAFIGWSIWAFLAPGDVDHRGAQAAILAIPIAAISLIFVAFSEIRLRVQDFRSDLTKDLARLASRVEFIEVRQRNRLLAKNLGEPIEIDVGFKLIPTPGRDDPAAQASGSLADITEYYERLQRNRLVISGGVGAGKTVLARHLILGLLESRNEKDPVPVMLSAARLGSTDQLNSWMAQQLVDVYDQSRKAALRLVNANLIIPVIDGFDVLDGIDSSLASKIIDQLNTYQGSMHIQPAILTARSDSYIKRLTWDSISERPARLIDAAWIDIDLVNPADAAHYLLERTTDRSRWQRVCEALESDTNCILNDALSTPWWLDLAFRVGEGGISGMPPERFLDFSSPDRLQAWLLQFYIAIALRPTRRYKHRQALSWLSGIATYLEENADEFYYVAGRRLPGADFTLYEIWPLAGERRVRVMDALIAAWCFVVALCVSMALLSASPTSWQEYFAVADFFGKHSGPLVPVVFG